LAAVFPVQGHTVQFQTVTDQLVAGLFSDPALQFLDLVVVEFHNLAALDVDQVVVMLVRRFFIASATISEVVLGENAGLLEQAHGPVNGGDRDVGIDRGRAAMHGLDIRVIVRLRQHTRDHAPLVGHLETAFGAQHLEFGFTIRHASIAYTALRLRYSCRVMTNQPDQTIDITAEVCPMTFVRTKLKLERMKPGEILSVRLSGEEPLRNVPRAAREEGHSILSIEDAGDAHIVTIRRA
jgi:tRNA 2-thiouridine synthesizing protein A